MRAFLDALFRDGAVSVSAEIDPEAVAIGSDVEEILQRFDRCARLELAHAAPPFDIAAAGWAAQVLYRSCQFLLLRQGDADEMMRLLDRPCPSPRGPATDYSADLFLRYLPDVHALALRLAPSDPLVARLVSLGASWPLSSVAIHGVMPLSLETFIDSPALRQLYADRIIEHEARARITDPRVALAVAESLGAFPALSPGIAAALETFSSYDAKSALAP